MTPERRKIPDWASRESNEDSCWIVENVDVFWLFASRAFEDTGRGAIVVDNTIQTARGSGRSFGHFSQERVLGALTACGSFKTLILD